MLLDTGSAAAYTNVPRGAAYIDWPLLGVVSSRRTSAADSNRRGAAAAGSIHQTGRERRGAPRCREEVSAPAAEGRPQRRPRRRPRCMVTNDTPHCRTAGPTG